MDERVIIGCPHCAERYRVRKDIVGRTARCSKCKKPFLLVVPGSIDEDEILSLVSPALTHRAEDDYSTKTATVAGLKVIDNQTTPLNGSAAPHPASNLGPPLKLEALDTAGAHFFFSAELMKTEKFRASIPKVCAGCYEKRGLHVYLLHWPLTASGPAGYGARYTPRAVTALGELPPLDTVELLKYLPTAKELPEPFSLPFPYYVCPRCKPEGLVYPSSVIGQSRESGLLTISNLDLAFEFYTANCGTDTADYQQLLGRSHACRLMRWESLAEGDRKRIGEWFKPLDNEQFVCYVPDCDTAPARRGQTGIVVTNRRVVCGKNPLVRQYSFNEHLTVTTQSVAEGTKVDISSANQNKISFRLADASWVNLRCALDNLKIDVRFLKI